MGGLGLAGEHLWPGRCPWNPAGLSPKWCCGSTFQSLTTPSQVHEGSVQHGTDGWWPQQLNPWNITLLGGRVWAGGWALSGRDGWARLHTQSGLWNPTPWKSLDSLLFWSCLQWEAVSWCGLAAQLSHHMLEFFPVNKRIIFLCLLVKENCLTVVSP